MLAKILRLILMLALMISLSVAACLHMSFGWPLFLALGAGLLMPLAGHAALLGFEFLLTSRIGRRAQPSNDAEDTERLNLGGLLTAWMTEVPTAIRVFGIQMPWTGDRPLASAEQPVRIPIVLIHGYFCNRALFRQLAAHLARRGHLVESVNLEPVFGSIDQYPSLIDNAVKTALHASPGNKVVLIGHSMGGIAARAYLRDFGQSHIAQVITLGSPHHGTELARIGHTEIVRQLRPNNSWLNELRRSEPPDRYRLFTVILSEHDNIVAPQRTQTLVGARTISVSGLGHVDLACHPAIFQLIDTTLESDKSQAGLRTTAEST